MCAALRDHNTRDGRAADQARLPGALKDAVLLLETTGLAAGPLVVLDAADAQAAARRRNAVGQHHANSQV